MFIEVNDNNGTKYLRLVESKRAFTKSGKPTCKKNIIFSALHKRYNVQSLLHQVTRPHWYYPSPIITHG